LGLPRCRDTDWDGTPTSGSVWVPCRACPVAVTKGVGQWSQVRRSLTVVSIQNELGNSNLRWDFTYKQTYSYLRDVWYELNSVILSFLYGERATQYYDRCTPQERCSEQWWSLEVVVIQQEVGEGDTIPRRLWKDPVRPRRTLQRPYRKPVPVVPLWNVVLW
jgi:hypothetical protein